MVALKPSAAFAAGLWIGALVGILIGALYFRYIPQHGLNIASPPTVSERQVSADKLTALQSDNARLRAELQRLKETIYSLKAYSLPREPTEMEPPAAEPGPVAPPADVGTGGPVTRPPPD